jgi:hypothetical protein
MLHMGRFFELRTTYISQNKPLKLPPLYRNYNIVPNIALSKYKSHVQYRKHIRFGRDYC